MSNEEFIALIKKNLFGTICGIVSLAAFGWWYYRGDDVPAAEKLLGEKQTESARYGANIASAKQLKEQLDALIAANKEINARLVRAGDLGKNVNVFFKIEAETATKLLDNRQIPLPTRREPLKTAYQGIPFAVGAKGDLGQLLGFLRRIENGSHYCRVLTAIVAASPDRTQPLTLNLSLELLGHP
ncbi:MAG: hypothetical protein RLZZ15_3884 [Verrucomicrobiota bacterium]|jgi:hypothetical protein